MAPRFRRREGDGRILPAYCEQQVNNDWMPLARAIAGRHVTYAPLGLMMAALSRGPWNIASRTRSACSCRRISKV